MLAFSDANLPQAALEDNAERVRAAVANASELQGLQRSCANAWLLYKRTRPAASPESVTRARSMPAAGVHPDLAAACPQSSLAGLEAQVSPFIVIVHADQHCRVHKSCFRWCRHWLPLC